MQYNIYLYIIIIIFCYNLNSVVICQLEVIKIKQNIVIHILLIFNLIINMYKKLILI